MDGRVVLLDLHLWTKWTELLEEPEPGLWNLFGGRRHLRRGLGKRGGGECLGEEVIELRDDPGVVDEVEIVLVAVDTQFFDSKRRTLREDQVCQAPEFLDRYHPIGEIFGPGPFSLHLPGLAGLFHPSHPVEDTKGITMPG